MTILITSKRDIKPSIMAQILSIAKSGCSEKEILRKIDLNKEEVDGYIVILQHTYLLKEKFLQPGRYKTTKAGARFLARHIQLSLHNK